MKSWYVVFKIKNSQEEYVKCLQVAEALLKGEARTIQEGSFCKNITVIQEKRALLPSHIIEGHISKDMGSSEICNIEQGDNVTYLFQVECTQETDIVDFIYYCLLQDKVCRNSILCIECSQKERANINDLLSDLLMMGIMKEAYTLIGGVCRKMTYGKVRVIKQFSPIYRIDEKESSAEYWHQSVHNFLTQLYKKRDVLPGVEGKCFLETYFLPHIAPTNLHKKYPDEIWGKSADFRERRILNNLVECFCSREKNRVEFSEERYSKWKSKEFFEMVKDMPLLAMYIFCVYDYFCADDDSDETLQREIFAARDMADGLIQILENIYHSENRCGYFCFRVHNNSEERSGKYLAKKYGEYLNHQESPAQNYFEIKVADFSRYTIPAQFYKDYKSRMLRAKGADKDAYVQLEQQAAVISVASFYETSEFWQRYNMISENMVHHYGLQAFESMVSCYNGFFCVHSQKEEDICEKTEYYCTHGGYDSVHHEAIPGTQYDILIPFHEAGEMQNISLDININYTKGLLRQYHLCRGIGFTTKYCSSVFAESASENLSYQQRKELTIRKLAKQLQDKIGHKKPEDRIVYFYAEEIALTVIELFCKALMLCIAKRAKDSCFYVMITECTQSHFVEITRMMALFYNKQGENPLMKNVQIFMSGKNEGEEFLITGSNLGEAVGSSEKLAFARCIHPNCLKILRKMLNSRRRNVMLNDVVQIVPFDMIKYDRKKETLLEQNLRSVLCQDIQSDKFGCMLENLHVRIGSKVHIRTFYEAELLFHNNYYTSRFAYWLFNELDKDRNLDKDRPFVLVGYENYSEMLLNELCNIFKESKIDTDYLVYEDRMVGKFRGIHSLKTYRDYQFILIIPINSTLTTHIKIAGFLEKAIREALRGEDSGEYKLGKVINYGIVLIAPEGNNPYWKNSGKNVITSKINGEKMKYYIKVTSRWMNPLACEACFPQKDYMTEVPLVETNKESVVPMHAINIRRNQQNVIDVTAKEDDKKENHRLEELSKFLVYRHVERNGNHFSYYFATERLWNFPEIRKNIQEWLRSKNQELFNVQEKKVYDIIVAPLHYSNTTFVEEVNEHLFSNAALVLHFDADREFRMNVRTKYSSVQQLYDNLCLDNEKSVINFHYIDDTIVSGRTIRRMKSLIASLIRERKGVEVEINVFKSIVLLLSRMSSSSVRDFIEDTRYFLAYFKLDISSMRVNSDACVLCKKYGEWKELARQASLNTVYNYWKKKSEDIKCISVEKIDFAREFTPDRQKRAMQYMTASHKAKKLMDRFCDYGDRDLIREMIVEKLLPDKIEDAQDELIAMLKVLGRPFLTFRKEEKETVFELMLYMLDVLLTEDMPKTGNKLDELLGQIRVDSRTRVLLVEILVNRLTELGANYIIRKRSMERILRFGIDNISDEEERQNFLNNYRNRIKQLAGQSNDFAKCLYIEYLLLYGEEYRTDVCKDKLLPLDGNTVEDDFKKNLYLENTMLVDYGVEYLAESFSDGKELTAENLIRALNENYYFDNFIQYLQFHRVVQLDQRDKVVRFESGQMQKKLEGMVRFELLYQKMFNKKNILGYEIENLPVGENDLKDKFTEMLECLRDACGAVDGEIIMPYEAVGEGEKYIALELGKSNAIRELENNERGLLEFMKRNCVFEEDTYVFCKEDDQNYQWILLKFCEETQQNQSAISVIYMLFPFKMQDEGMLVHSLKNLLIFRYKILEILNISRITLLQNWTDNLFYKQQMLKSRAVGHSELDTLLDQFLYFTEHFCVEKYEQKTGMDKLVYDSYFEILVNNMIGSMNAQVLGNHGANYGENAGRSFMSFWEGEKKAIEVISKIWGLEMDVDDSISRGNFRIRHGANELADKSPSCDTLRILLLAVCHNIWRHGKKYEHDLCHVNVYVDQEQLCILNAIKEEEKDKIADSISDEAYRSGEGISQAVIFDICQSWYDNLRYTEMFQICLQEKNSGEEWVYMVKLPVIERWEREWVNM